MASPWLFSGGVGGPFEIRLKKKTLRAWMEDCIYYEEVRFADDKVFAFYVLNYVNRHTNSSQGRYYVKEFKKDFDCLEDFQDAVG